jgi:ribosomal protein S18 acetylase RimI-like enzyme
VENLRDATEDDAPAVAAVWEAVAAEGEWIGTEAPLRPDWQDRFRGAVAEPTSHWIVATADDGDDVDVDVGRVVGAIFVGDDGGLAHVGMAIIDGHRGRGLGRRLLLAGIEWAAARGAHKVALEVWPHNDRARRLYESAGFVVEGLHPRHYRRRSGALWDAVSMGLVLDHDAPGR